MTKDEQILALRIKVSNLQNERKILIEKMKDRRVLIKALAQSANKIAELRHQLRVYKTFDEYERKIANE